MGRSPKQFVLVGLGFLAHESLPLFLPHATGEETPVNVLRGGYAPGDSVSPGTLDLGRHESKGKCSNRPLKEQEQLPG